MESYEISIKQVLVHVEVTLNLLAEHWAHTIHYLRLYWITSSKQLSHRHWLSIPTTTPDQAKKPPYQLWNKKGSISRDRRYRNRRATRSGNRVIIVLDKSTSISVFHKTKLLWAFPKDCLEWLTFYVCCQECGSEYGIRFVPLAHFVNTSYWHIVARAERMQQRLRGAQWGS